MRRCRKTSIRKGDHEPKEKEYETEREWKEHQNVLMNNVARRLGVFGERWCNRFAEVALETGADVPVCLASRACDMTGVGEGLLPLNLPEFPSVLVNPSVPVATRDVFDALGLRNGELLVGVTDVLESPAWPEDGASIADWVEALSSVGNDLEAPAMRIQPMISDVLSALHASEGALLARMSGSGATCFAIYPDRGKAQAASDKIRRAHPDWWVHAGVLS